MLCPNCETENSDDARLCVECGFPLSGSIARGAGAASPSRVKPAYERPFMAPQPTYEAPRKNLFQAQEAAPQPQPEQHQAPSIFDAGPREFSWDSHPHDDYDEPLFDMPADELPAYEPFDGGYDASYANSREQNRYDAQYSEHYEREYEDATVAFKPLARDEYARTDAVQEHLEPAYNPAGLGEIPKDDFEFSFDDLDIFADDDPFANDTLQFADDIGNTDRVAPIASSNRPSAQRGRNKDFRAPGEKRGLSGKQIALIAVSAVVVIAAIVAVVGFALGIWGGVAVPNVVGKTQAEAESILEDSGFTVKTLQVKSDESEGIVLVMDPGAGSFAEEGSQVVIHIATARTIPDIVGETQEDAAKMLADAGYANVKYEVEYTDGEEGIVLAVSPEPDTRAKSSMEIIVTISENFKVPEVAGMSLDEAFTTVEKAGLVPTVLYVDTDQYPDGTVMGTDPEAGTKVTEGANVAVTVARMRGAELKAIAEDMLSAGETVDIGGVSYQIESVTSLNYEGNDTVSFTVIGKPFVQFFGETLYASSSQTITGVIEFASDNSIVGIY